MTILGKLTIYDTEYYVDPQDYEVIYDGEPSKLLPSSNATIVDVGYVRPGFTAKLLINDAYDVLTLQNKIRTSLITKSPTIVIDTLYPGNRTWYGLFQTQLIKGGKYRTQGLLGLPDGLYVTPVTVTFYSNTLEQM